MPSIEHQWLLVWGIRKMQQDGFGTAAFDGVLPQCDFNGALPQPFAVKAVRADAWGYSDRQSLVAFVEAKRTADINRAHTRKQLRVLGNARMRNTGGRCPLYVAIPRSAAYELDRALIDTGLIGARHVIRVYVPDALLQENSYAARQPSARIAAAPSHRY